MASVPLIVAALLSFFLTPDCTALARPRIFITPQDLPRIRAMAHDTTRNALGYVPAEAWEFLKARADDFVAAGPYHYAVEMPGVEGGPSQHWEYTLSAEPPPRHDDYRHYPPWTAMFQERADSITTRLQHYLLAYVIAQDAKYLDRAKEIVLAMCQWPGIWTDPSYGSGQPCLDTGHAAAWVSIFYDWCHDGLSDSERAMVRAALVDKALVPIDSFMDSWAPYHNGTAVIANGLCLGGIALLGEDPRATGWIDHAVSRMLLNFDAQGKDGGPMEGPGYGTYAADQIADMVWALDSAGIPNRLRDHPYLRTLPRYCVTLANPNNQEMPCFGDGGPTRGCFARLMISLALAGDTDAAWYCQQSGLFDPRSVRNFLALDPDRLHCVVPGYNPSGCYVDVGYAILRDGYRSGSAFMAFKSGPPTADVGHNHFDHNSFVINYAGHWVAWDPGYRSYFDPPDRRYTTSTLGHSSIVLDLDDDYLTAPGHPDCVPGHDQIRLSRGRIREFFTSADFDYVCGEAAETYNPDDRRVLDRFTRQIVFAKPAVFFIRDTLSAPQEHTYSFLLHLPPGGQFTTVGSCAEAVVAGACLQTCVFSPHGLTLSTATYPGAEHRGPYLVATTGRTREAVLTTVLVPRHHSRLITNPGFERGMVGWTPRSTPDNLPNHVIDRQEKHTGQASGRIDNRGYYYTEHFMLPPGARITARWWAKCTAPTGASSVLYYWRNGASFAHKPGPVADVNEWRQYELSDVVPEGTQEVCLALQFFGQGQCWYDDVEITSDQPVPEAEPTQVTSLGEGADGAVVHTRDVTYVLLCGTAGKTRTVHAAGRTFETDAEVAAVTLDGQRPAVFMVRGTRLTVDGAAVPPAPGEWRVEPVG